MTQRKIVLSAGVSALAVLIASIILSILYGIFSVNELVDLK